jgi:hypothetical protein
MCKNKFDSKCVGTGTFLQRSQKYGNYSYCCGCVSKYKILGTIRKIFQKKIDDLDLFNGANCESCGKPPKTPTYSYNKPLDCSTIDDSDVVNGNITVFCSKCALFKKNKQKYIKYPFIDDIMINDISLFNNTLSASEADTVSLHFDIDDIPENTENNYAGILGLTKVQELNEVHELNEVQELNEVHELNEVQELNEVPKEKLCNLTELQLKNRMKSLVENINKMSFAYLVCKVCSDDEIYKRIIAESDKSM